MATRFSDFMAELKREAEAEGPEAVAELKQLRERYRVARRFAEARRRRGWTPKKLAQITGLSQSEMLTPRKRSGESHVPVASGSRGGAGREDPAGPRVCARVRGMRVVIMPDAAVAARDPAGLVASRTIPCWSRQVRERSTRWRRATSRGEGRRSARVPSSLPGRRLFEVTLSQVHPVTHADEGRPDHGCVRIVRGRART